MRRVSHRQSAETAKSAAVPLYDRATLTAGIIHFGVGNFHRSHQAIYLDDLFNTARAMTLRSSAQACARRMRRCGRS